MLNKNKNIVVTGTTGQDGSYMVEYLLENFESRVFGLVRRNSNPNYSNIKVVLGHSNFELAYGDLTDSHSIENIVRRIKPDYFINFAGQSDVHLSWEIPQSTWEINTTGVMNVLEAVRKHAHLCRTYNAGSSEEWGDVIYSPQDEQHPPRARSPYAASKVAARQLVKSYRESYKLYVIQGTLFNHESIRRSPAFVTRKITLGVAKISKAFKENKDFEPLELGNLDSLRDWSHAKDFINGVWRMVNQEKYRSDLGEYKNETNLTILSPMLREYVLSSGENHTVREFVEKAFKVAGYEGVWINGGLDEEYIINGQTVVKINPRFYRPAEVSTLLGNSTKARIELGWEPKITFDQLVKEMVESDLCTS